MKGFKQESLNNPHPTLLPPSPLSDGAVRDARREEAPARAGPCRGQAVVLSRLGSRCGQVTDEALARPQVVQKSGSCGEAIDDWKSKCTEHLKFCHTLNNIKSMLTCKLIALRGGEGSIYFDTSKN